MKTAISSSAGVLIPEGVVTTEKLIQVRDEVRAIREGVNATQRALAKQTNMAKTQYTALAAELVKAGIFLKAPNMHNNPVDFLLSYIDEEVAIRERGWLPFAQQVYGGHGYCGYFIHNLDTPWYLGGVDEDIEVEIPLALRQKRGYYKICFEGRYSTYTPHVYPSKSVDSQLKTPLPDKVARALEYAKSTGVFKTFLVASPDPEIFKTKKAVKRDPILIGEKWKRWDTRDGGAATTYAMEWLVIAAWGIAQDMEAVMDKGCP